MYCSGLFWDAWEREFGRVCGFHHLLVCYLDGDGVRGGFEVWEVGLGGEVVAGGTGVYDGLGYGGPSARVL